MLFRMLRNHSRLAAALAVVLAAGVSACTAGSPAAPRPGPTATSAAPGPASGTPAAAAPTTVAGYYAQRLDWRPCARGFQCARLLVPFDYTRPAGPHFSLPVVKLGAADRGSRI